MEDEGTQCTEQLGCNAGFVAICYFDSTVSGKSKGDDLSDGGYISGCFPASAVPVVGDSGVDGFYNRITAACGPCNCFDTIPTETTFSKSKGDAPEPNGSDNIGFSTNCPDPPAAREPTDPPIGDGGTDGGCSICESGKLEFRYNVQVESWEKHRAIAQLIGCELATIKTGDEQRAALHVLESYSGYAYENTHGWNSAVAFIGGKLIENYFPDNDGNTRWNFDWVDGTSFSAIQSNNNFSSQDTFFQQGDPNGISGAPTTAEGGVVNEPYLAMLLGENGSSGLTKGEWVDVGADLHAPALYKCCAKPDLTECSVPLEH